MAAGLVPPKSTLALKHQDAIALAQRGNPALAQSVAQTDVAEAPLAQPRAGRLPALTLSGDAGQGTTDLGGFFGFVDENAVPMVRALLRLYPPEAPRALGWCEWGLVRPG